MNRHIPLLVIFLCRNVVTAFVISGPFGLRSQSSSTHLLSTKNSAPKEKKNSRSPSKVTDFDGPTPDSRGDHFTEIDEDDVPELRDVTDRNDLPRPIPHQPWRRGDTAGCEAPLSAPWRQKAENVIYKAANFAVGDTVVLDVTWYLTALVITLDGQVVDDMPIDILKSSGPVIEVVIPELAVYKDPDDPNPRDVIEGEDDIISIRRTPEEEEYEQERKKKMWAKKTEDDDPDEPDIPNEGPAYDDVSMFMNEETRPYIAYNAAVSMAEDFETGPKRREHHFVDTPKISTIAKAILDGLEFIEEECNVLKRHELIFTTPNGPDVLESQKQFNAYRNKPVLVETQDPFDSNRTLKGTLVDRNAMDVIINQKGRMVTIPLNFVRCVRLPAKKSEDYVEESSD